ncbi:hypothetical protein PT300_13180 [Enterobacteriaceae bacterium ESL0689]|nr:hypothetical protein [Enterobacteriaceae bacterium ESL0689]
MNFGLKIINNDGSVWLSPEFTPLNLITKGSVSGSDGTIFQSEIPSANNCMFFVKFATDGLALFSRITQNGCHALRVDRVALATGIITIYAFSDICINIPKYGVFMFNSSGKMIYHAGMMPLELSQVAISLREPVVSVGFQCAVSPTFSGATSEPDFHLGGYILRRHYTGACGRIISNRAVDAGSLSGPISVAYQTSALIINTEKYD